MNTKPEALRLADSLDIDPSDITGHKAAAELRRLYAEHEELLKALDAVVITCDWHGDDGREAMKKALDLLLERKE